MTSLKKFLTSNKYLFLLLGIVTIFFYPFFIFGKIPIPADTIVGMYHPYKDVTWNDYKLGVPFKNYLITDPVRQQYIWRNLAIENIKRLKLPIWNPYSFSGYPLLANFQTAVFYPLNILFFIFSFDYAWSILVILQPILSGIFLYFYLSHIKVSKIACFMGALSFSFSGFIIAWLEWNTIVHVVLWLPLILLAIEQILQKISWKWIVILFFSASSQIFAGHLQFFFYSIIISNIYLLIRIVQFSLRQKVENTLQYFTKKYLPFMLIGFSVLIITSIQWIPTYKFIINSSRNYDQGSFMKDGWFLPWNQLLMFLAPDFFGNPTTQNYWGVWNYAEMIGYIGIVPLIFSLFAIFFRRDLKTIFFAVLVILALLFSLPNSLSKLPYIWKIPYLSSSQPTRLIYIIDFALCILASLGFDHYVHHKNHKKILFIILALLIVIFFIWLIILIPNNLLLNITDSSLLIAKRNLVLPTFYLISSFIIFLLQTKKKEKLNKIITIFLFSLIIIDLFRFGWKFTPYSEKNWIFPKTNIINFLQKNIGNYRIMALDRRIMPPNFAAFYHLPDVSGYDPLYLKSYNQLIASWDRNLPDITPASYNRIITPNNYKSFITNLLSVKYLLSYGPLESDKLTFLLQEGNTLLYQNDNAFPKAYFVEEVVNVSSIQEEINKMYELKDNLRFIAVTSQNIQLSKSEIDSDENIETIQYQEDEIEIDTKVSTEKLMVMSDLYYPSWKAYIDGKETKLYRVDFALRGIVIPKGNHKILLKVNLI